jgi:hypothetical protein
VLDLQPERAAYFVFRGDARPVVDVANRIGHSRRRVLHKVSSSGTRSEKAAQAGVFTLLCGSECPMSASVPTSILSVGPVGMSPF